MRLRFHVACVSAGSNPAVNNQWFANQGVFGINQDNGAFPVTFFNYDFTQMASAVSRARLQWLTQQQRRALSGQGCAHPAFLTHAPPTALVFSFVPQLGGNRHL